MLLITLSTMLLFTNMLMYLAKVKSTSSRSISNFRMCSTSRNSIINGDSTSIKTYSSLMKNGQLADALITDPPYCILERRRKNGDLRDPKRIKKKLDDEETVSRFENVKAFTIFTKSWLDIAIKFIKPYAPLIIWTNALGKVPTINLCKQHNYTLVGDFLWAKRTKVMNKDEILTSTKNEILVRIYETALVFRHNSALKHKSSDDSDLPIPWSVITGYHDSDTDNITTHEHPCHKPFETIEPLIRTWTKPGDIILDCFAGSGGIVCSAARLNRVARGIEILPHWAEYTNKKIQEITTK